jgi:uncharacterized protein DUF397
VSADSHKWFKSSYSGGANTECVEVAVIRDGALVRDSGDPMGPVLAFAAPAWTAFITGIQGGEIHPAE